MTSAHARDDVRIFLKECTSLAQHGHDVILLVADGLGHGAEGMVKIHDVGRASGRLDRMLRVPSRLVEAAMELGADICHLHDPELLRIAVALSRRGSKVVFDAHEDVPRQILAKHYLYPWARKGISRIFAAYERRICRNLAGVVCATPTIRDKFKGFARQVVDVNNYPLLGELDPPGDVVRSGREVCYVGGLATIRGVREIVQAVGCCQHAGTQLHLVGHFIEPEVEAALRVTSDWHKVEFWGQQDREGVRNVLARSSIGLVTLHPTANYIDALPVKMFEYMAAGIPVIASNFPLWRGIVEQADCGVCVDPLDPQAIARAIDELLSNPQRAQRLGENGRQAVYERFNWQIEEAKLLDFYASLTKEAF
ncbi:MAG: glycosyltransferase family 4 protein [Alcaligenaceae bacterium]|nr:glycosyltransferase family 4 protein [Alcaligenaceae bacterium]